MKKKWTWSALRWEILNSILSPDFAILCLCNLNILSLSLSLLTVCECVMLWRVLSLSQSLISQQLLKITLFMIFHELLRNHHHQPATETKRERERALAQWSLLRRVLFYCSFKQSNKPSLTERNGKRRNATTKEKIILKKSSIGILIYACVCVQLCICSVV